MKESHDIFKTWQDRFFVLDCKTKKIRYYTEAQKINQKGEYEFTANSTVEASTANSSVPNLFVLTGKTQKENVSELFMSASSAELRKKWMESIKKAIKVIY